jgi:hypothetical protein
MPKGHHILSRRQEETIDVTQRLGRLLRDYRVGHPQWYAELLVAAALDGETQPTNHPKFDVLAPVYGRVEVKNRVDGTDSTQNRTNFGRYCDGDFDHAAIIVFTPTYLVKCGIILPCTSVLPLVRPHGHVPWANAARHPDAQDITDQLRRVSGE